MNQNLFRGVGAEIRLISDDSFLKIRETLTRIGVASKTEQKIFQSCHILHKMDKETDRSRYVILHFKELFILDGKNDTLSEEDKGRRNTITNLLEEWNLLEIVNPDQTVDPILPLSGVKIIPFRDKPKWELISKYTIGSKKV